MEFLNSHLSNYINDNTSSITQKRAMEVLIYETEYDTVNEIANFKVVGSETYLVSLLNYKSAHISGTCTCPYDYGSVCKHIVAIAKIVDEYLGAPQTEEIKSHVHTIEKKESKNRSQNQLYLFDVYNKTYIFNKDFVRALNYDTFLKISTKNIYSQSTRIHLDDVFYDKDTSTLTLFLKPDYWSYSFINTVTTFKDNTLDIQTDCQCQKNRACKHIIKTLELIQDKYQYLILTEKELNQQKEQLLNEYGFSIEDLNYQKYFDFLYTTNGVELKHKVKGIVSTENIGMLADLKESVIGSDELIDSYLPKTTKKTKVVKKSTIALGIHFSHDYTDAFIKPMIGNIDADGEISTSIKYLDYKLFFEKQHSLSDDYIALVKLAYNLTYEESRPKEKGYFSTKITTLNELIDKAHKLDISFFELLDYDSYRIQKRNLYPIQVQKNTGDLSFEVREKDVFFETNVYLKINKKKKLTSYKTKKNYLFAVEDNIYYLHPNKNICDIIQFFSQVPSFKVIQKDFEEFQRNILHPIEEKHSVNYLYQPKIKVQKKTDTVFKKQLYLSQLNEHILLKPAIAYQDNIVLLYSGKKVIVKNGNTTYEIPRNKNLENNFDSQLRDLHPKFAYQTNEFFFLEQEDLMKNEWFLHFFDKVKELEIEVFGRNDLKLKYNQNKPSISININSEIDWFDVSVEVSFGDQQVSLRDLKKSIINKDKYIALKDGSIGILPEDWIEKHFSIFKSGTISKDSIKVSKYQFSVVDALYENYQNNTNLFEEHLKIREKLQNFSSVKNIQSPRGINATLRPYQKEGLKWLNFLDDFNLGGCLADDMGLGKTLQIISFLKHLKTKKKKKNAHLVVVPTSLIFNWNEEVLKFCPELKVYTHTGIKREKETSTFDNFDIVLTTYGLVINDSKMLSSYEFHYIILDESQAIKNPNSKRYKAIKVLKSRNRLVMTGTPIENNTFDLYAQMNFINPGLLGGIQQFKTDYANAIDKNKDVIVAQELREVIHPFLMRRTKEQVMTDLPPKTEQVLYCEMGKEQRKVYETFKNQYRNYLLGKIETEGFEKSQIYILQALTKLRQICNSPSLLSEEEDYTNESVKIDLLLENILEKTGNHKILVFSQFTSMLSLIKNRLQEKSVSFEYLDGSTRDRQSKVENFQSNDDSRVFLISLKAGGTGLNLTAADYVYIVDPWWNPAAEAQAIDRCYRIGQNKKVMAYKMICKDSIEEKIVQLQENKKQVSNDLIQTEKSFVKQLTKTSLQELFK